MTNKAHIAGRVAGVNSGALANGQPVVTMLVRLASDGGGYGYDLVRVVCYGKLAEVARARAIDGVGVDVTGRLQSRWVQPDDHRGWSVVEVVASGLHFGPPRAEGGA